MEVRNSTKYHYLKFIEKQKVERKLKTCRRLLEAASVEHGGDGDGEVRKDLKKRLRGHLADYEYVEHYPRHLPYNALFPKEDSEASQSRREEIRKLIRKTLQESGEGTVRTAGEMDGNSTRTESGEAGDLAQGGDAMPSEKGTTKKKNNKEKQRAASVNVGHGQEQLRDASCTKKKKRKKAVDAVGISDREAGVPDGDRASKARPSETRGRMAVATANGAHKALAPTGKKRRVAAVNGATAGDAGVVSSERPLGVTFEGKKRRKAAAADGASADKERRREES